MVMLRLPSRSLGIVSREHRGRNTAARGAVSPASPSSGDPLPPAGFLALRQENREDSPERRGLGVTTDRQGIRRERSANPGKNREFLAVSRPLVEGNQFNQGEPTMAPEQGPRAIEAAAG
jgi:hypothetical protein